jgi:uncharacterized protein
MVRSALVLIFLVNFLSTAYSQDIFAGEEIEIPINGGILSATLSAPEGARTVVILHAGSGPTDRDGNQAQMKNNSLKQLSDQLNEKGLATFRYDKRGIGKSTLQELKEENVSVDTFVTDLRLWIAELENTGNYDHIYLAGHSEGALISTLAAQNNPAIKGLISIAGTGRPAGQLLKDQLKSQPQFVLDAASPIIDELMAGNKVDSVPVFLNSIFRKSVQPYIISWFKYDPSEEIGKLQIPTLIIQGGTDMQVHEEDAKLLDQAALKSELLIIPDMNHVLKETEFTTLMEQMKIYSDPEAPLHNELVEKIISFIKSNQ